MISVCLATYNGEKYIIEQLNSILVQLEVDDEIVISDDGSTDNTLNIINEINDKRIRVVINNLKKGVNNNFENALNNSKGDFIFLSDQDDIWMSNKVDVCIKELNNYDLVVSNCKVIDQQKNVTHDSYFDLVKSGKGFFKNFYKSSYLGCCLAFKRRVIEEILPMPENLLLFHDWWFGFISELCFKVKFIDTPCMYYRRHSETNSNTLSKSHFSFSQKFKYRFQLLYYGGIKVIKIKSKNVI